MHSVMNGTQSRWMQRGSRAALAAAALVWAGGCSADKESIINRHVSDNPRAAAQQRWQNLRADVKTELAEKHFSAGRLDEAQSIAEQVLEQAPQNARLLTLMARIQLERGRLAQALEAIGQARALAPQEPEIHYVAGMVAERHGDLTTALEDYTEAARLSPDMPDYLMARAEVMVALDQPIEALAQVQERLNDFEGNVPLRVLTARIHQMLGLREPAAARSREALQLSPDDEELAVELSGVLVWAEAYPDAIAALEPVVQRRIHDGSLKLDAQQDALAAQIPEAIHVLARCYLEAGRPASARDIVKPLVRHDGGDETAWHLYARAALQMDDLPEAGRIVEQIQRRFAPRPQTALLAAFVAFRQASYLRTIELAGQALRLDPDAAAAHLLIGQALEANGRTAEALAAYDQALALEPRSQVARTLQQEARHKVRAASQTGGSIRETGKVEG